MKSIALLICNLMLVGTAHAQFGNILNDIKKNIEKDLGSIIQQGLNKPTGDPANKTQIANQREKLLSGYCDKISNSDFIRKIGEIYQKSAKADNPIAPRYKLTDSNEFNAWISEKFQSELNISVGTAYQQASHVSVVYDTINECLKKNHDNIFTDAFVSWNIKKGSEGFYIPSANSKKDSIRGSDSRQMLMFAFLFDGADEKMTALFPKLIQDYDSEVQAAINQQDIHRKYAEEKRSKDEANAAADAKLFKEREERQKLESAFLATSDGQLTSMYQKFQVIQTCFDIRKDFAIKFVSSSEFSEFKSKIKNAEAKLKNSLKEKNTDLLWANAEKRNRSFDISGGFALGNIDLIEHIKSNNKSNWVAAKEDCDTMAQLFRDDTNELLGKESLKKKF